MMRIWRREGIDHLLKKAYARDIVLSGLSAGSICWFREGHSDSRKVEGKDWNYIKVKGLGFISTFHCPHYDTAPGRKEHLKQVMRTTSGVALAIDNCCALEVVDNQYRVVNAKKGAGVYRVYWKKGRFFEEKLEPRQDFAPLHEPLRIN